MDPAAWIAILVAVVLILGGLSALLMATSVLVEPGTLALLLKRGEATSRALEPGRHFMQPWRKAMVQVYPSRELALVAGGPGAGDQRVDAVDAPLRLHLGDKVFAELSYTVRCRLDTAELKDVHNRFGPEGIWSALRDTTRQTLIGATADVSIDDAFASAFTALEQRLGSAMQSALADIGFILTMFSLREIDLGDTGEVIQSTLRAGAELEREQALTAVRRARIENDASMRDVLGGVDGDVMLRYRQIEALSQILQRWGGDRPIPSALMTPLTPLPTMAVHPDVDTVAPDDAHENESTSDQP